MREAPPGRPVDAPARTEEKQECTRRVTEINDGHPASTEGRAAGMTQKPTDGRVRNGL